MPLSALMLLEFLEVDSGQWIIHNAANGAVGKTLAMLAAARGVNTINLVRSKDSLEELTALDIKNNVVTADDDWKDQSAPSLVTIKSQPPLTRSVVSRAMSCYRY